MRCGFAARFFNRSNASPHKFEGGFGWPGWDGLE